MTIEELEQLLEGGAETQRIDFKESCSWDVKKFAKDILAMANVQGGGYIVIGVKQKDDHFEREGVSENHETSFKIDLMKDQISAYADPCVNFKMDFPEDKKRIKYIVIYIYEFDEIPVICKKDSEDTAKTKVYYRNRDRRWESAPISNSYDMKDLIERAAVKMMRKYKKLGLFVEVTDMTREKLYDDEAKDLL